MRSRRGKHEVEEGLEEVGEAKPGGGRIRGRRRGKKNEVEEGLEEVGEAERGRGFMGRDFCLAILSSTTSVP
ncbi:hypothetical protein Pcinc_041894 [Petrolisthes cinctipes]|uniref:Uncharacterized protein n=1 Tax=Petrolisthes cinctipes TaxID=88211 RepID=A0AAE1EGG8_PETCI|nr:hypothetical protein Pcinc_041894 [Petrolisthes cinctipes]